MTTNERVCRDCGNSYPDTDEYFYPYKNGYTKRSNTCKNCLKKNAAQSNKDNSDRYKNTYERRKREQEAAIKIAKEFNH